MQNFQKKELFTQVIQDFNISDCPVLILWCLTPLYKVHNCFILPRVVYMFTFLPRTARDVVRVKLPCLYIVVNF